VEAPLPFAVVVAAVVVLVLLLELKTSRSDGELVADVPKFRRMMQFIMPSRNESVVYFDRAVRAENLEAYLEAVKGPLGANLTHVLVGAFNIGLAENPKMNQFVVGRRLYRRNGRFLTFSMKRQKGKKKAKLSAVKLQMQDGETFKQLCDRINGGIKVERSGEKTAADKEYDVLDLLPRPGLRAMNKLLRVLDYYNVLPHFFIEGDGMYTSIFIANLGSVGMGAGYHHLYEHGTCPLFIMAGKVEDRVIVEHGRPVVARILPLRFTYDERIDDGLTASYGIESVVRVLEDPQRWLGCTRADGSDARPMWPHGEDVDLGDESAAAF
jgi:hypothetical protein